MTQAVLRQLAEAAASVAETVADGNARPEAARPRLDMMLESGGDERIWPDAVTRRNRYGTPTRPARDEIWLSSSTASAITARGYAGAARAFEAVTRPDADLSAWFDDLRARINLQLGAPGVEAILTASGTEAELAALAVAKALLGRPVANIVVAPEETGNGVALASTGAHFAATAAFEAHVEKGAPLAGWSRDEVVMRRVDIRDASGRPQSAAEVDRAACAAAELALRTGRDVLLHVLDASKTGRSGPSRAAAREIAACAGDRALVLVDACQLRCSFDQIRDDLAAGFLVMVTGSKFAGGPPFCGALLIPPAVVDRLGDLTLPAGLSAYAARCDWPYRFQTAFDSADFAPANLGMGLRWEAALAEIEAYALIPSPLRNDIVAKFAETARRCVAANLDLDFLDQENWRLGGSPSTLFPIITHHGDHAQARLIYASLRDPGGAALEDEEFARVCHVGQPVIVGSRAALRLCLGMPHINAVAERAKSGASLETAFEPLRRDIELTLRKWGALAKRIGATGALALAASNE